MILFSLYVQSALTSNYQLAQFINIKILNEIPQIRKELIYKTIQLKISEVSFEIMLIIIKFRVNQFKRWFW